MFCGDCGQPNNDAVRFCTSCGKPLEQKHGGGGPTIAPTFASLAEASKRPRTEDQTRYEEAEYGVPHCQFEKTAEGFKASFRKPTMNQMIFTVLLGIPATLVGMVVAARVAGSMFGFGAGALAFFVAFPVGIAVVIRLGLVVLATRSDIEVTRASVIIDRKVLSRRDFGHFNVGGTSTQSGKVIGPNPALQAGGSIGAALSHLSFLGAQIGYSYGLRTFCFGGNWSAGEATEVASALNIHLQKVPKEGDESTPPAELLQQAGRPQAF